jgi:hypothetical protein
MKQPPPPPPLSEEAGEAEGDKGVSDGVLGAGSGVPEGELGGIRMPVAAETTSFE